MAAGGDGCRLEVTVVHRLVLNVLELTAAAALLMAAPAGAQRPDARAFVDAVTDDVEGQVARFHEPLCPLAAGLPGDYNATVEARIRSVAQSVGVAVNGYPRCRANLILLVAEDADAALTLLRRRRPDIFTGLPASEVRRALDSNGPVRSWQSSEARRTGGNPIGENRHSALYQDVHLHHGIPASLLRETTRRELRLSVVLFELDAIDGLTLMQIADHAAMRGLASTRTGGAAAPSVLALFDGSASSRRPPAATGWDLAYLRALYDSDGSLPSPAHRGVLARLLERNLAQRSR